VQLHQIYCRWEGHLLKDSVNFAGQKSPLVWNLTIIPWRVDWVSQISLVSIPPWWDCRSCVIYLRFELTLVSNLMGVEWNVSLVLSLFCNPLPKFSRKVNILTMKWILLIIFPVSDIADANWAPFLEFCTIWMSDWCYLQTQRQRVPSFICKNKTSRQSYIRFLRKPAIDDVVFKWLELPLAVSHEWHLIATSGNKL
jgi:hypothetical protein